MGFLNTTMRHQQQRQQQRQQQQPKEALGIFSSRGPKKTVQSLSSNFDFNLTTSFYLANNYCDRPYIHYIFSFEYMRYNFLALAIGWRLRVKIYDKKFEP